MSLPDDPNEDRDTIIDDVLRECGIERTAEPVPDREYPLAKGTASGPLCWHAKHMVDPYRRRVECRDCGAELDPINVIASYAKDPDWILCARKDRARLERDVAALKLELAKLRGAMRRAKTAQNEKPALRRGRGVGQPG